MKFDTHIHTKYSPCSNIEPNQLVSVAVGEGLDEIVVKDHNVIQGARETRDFAREFCGEMLKVRLGIELATQFGEIGVSFLSDEEAEEIMRLREDNGKFGFFDVAEQINEMRRRKESQLTVDLHHPFDGSRRGSFDFDGLLESGFFASRSGLMNFFDTVELNTSCMRCSETQGAVNLADVFNKPVVCASDSHFLPQVGRYHTETKHPDAHSAIVAAGKGERGALRHSVIPEEIDYLRARYYRTLSGIRKMFKSAA
ncbi:PHP domain-containing protein [Patescibacteria group bacterium]|nr:PHP domain-containing protein [Patescibacteria group bacterium]